MFRSKLMTILSVYWFISIFSLIKLINCDGYITVRRPIVEYNMQSGVKYFQIDFNLDTNLQANNYIRLQFPITLHQTSQTAVYAGITTSPSSPLNPTTLTKIYSLTSSGVNEYTFTLANNLNSNVFYSIYVFPEVVSTFGWFSQGIRILGISGNANPIVFTKNVNSGSFTLNNALAPILNDQNYFSITKLSDSDSKIANLVDNSVSTSLGMTTGTTSPFDTMGIKYWLLLQVQIDTNIPGSTFIRFSINTPGNSEFILLNYCQIYKSASGSILSTQPTTSCSVDQNENFLEASILADVYKNDQFLILVPIQNAYFSFKNDVSLIVGNYYTRQVVSYRVNQSALVTKAITLTVEHLNLFFGVSFNDEEQNFPLGVFQSASSTAVPVYNSITLTFHAETSITLPNSRMYRAILNVAPATEVLSQSIKTSLVAVTGSSVYCKYMTQQIICDNIGSFVGQQRYSISFKAFFNEHVLQTDFTNFCSLSIQEYRLTNPQSSFLSTSGIYVNLYVNTDLRDLSATGWHSQAFEYTPVVSAPEGTSLNNIYNSAYSTTTGAVGITPDSNEQAILFLLNVPEQQYCNSNLALCANDYLNVLYFRSTILFNYNVIKFTSGKENNGIDFAAMNGSGQLDQASFRCTANSYCDKYDANSVKNTKKLILKDPTVTDEVSMGLVIFDCGVLQKDLDPGIKPSAVSNCQNLMGKGTAVGQNGIMALRNVRFDPSFKHNTYFADDTVLDFVVSFMRGIMVNSQIPQSYSFISTNLINAYTIVRQSLTTVKFGYINYFVDTTNNFNDGYNIPVLFRLGGQFPSTSAANTVQIAIFLDEAVDLSNFYWNQTTNNFVYKPYSYGCSESECYGYKVNKGGNLDAYHLHNMILVNLLATTDVTQPFNIIVPLANNNNNIWPLRVAVGLINNQGQMQAIFRLYGPPSYGDTTVATQITVLQGLAAQTTPFAFPLQPAGKKFTYSADGSNVKSSQTGSLVLNAATDTTTVPSGNTNGLWGAGLTIVSRNQDIFTSSRTSISFRNHPGSFKQCTLAKYNLVNHPSGNQKNGLYSALFCPVDDPALAANFFATNSADVINISTPFSYYWGSNLKLSNILQYALSDNKGTLLGSWIEANSVQAPVANMQRCIIDQTSPAIQPNSSGKQVITIPVSFNQDYTFDPLLLTNVNSFMIEITFSAVVTGFNLDGAYCQIKGYLQFQNYFSCTPTWTGQQIARVKLVALQAFVFQKGQTFSIELQVNENLTQNFDNTSVVFSVNIMLPDGKQNPTDNIPSVFTAPATVKVITESCSGGSLQLGSTPLGNQLEIKNLRTKFISQKGRGSLKIEFDILSTRFRINSGSYYLLTLGFLQDQNMNDNQRMDTLDCTILQRLSANPSDPYVTSYIFSSISYTASNQIMMTISSDLENPQTYTFQLFCINIRTPSSMYSSSQITMTVNDVENRVYFTSTAPISYTDISFAPSIQNNAITILSWTGYSQGQFTSYKFQIPNNLIGWDINQFSRIYANFPSSFNSNLSDSISCKQNGIQVECNLDPTQPRQLIIQLNQGPIVQNDSFTLEISNLANSYIDPSINGVYICLIRDFRTQIGKVDFISCDFQGIVPLQLKSVVSPTSVKNISVTKVYNKAASNKNQFNLGENQVFSFDMTISQGMFDYKNYLLVELPRDFAQYVLDTDSVACEIFTSSRQDNLSYGCTFLNSRYIQISLVKDPQNYFGSSQYTLNLYFVYIPEAFNSLLSDRLYFNFLIYDFNLQNILAYSQSYSSNPLQFITDNTYAHLKWVNTDGFTIYKGYYKSQISLYPQDNTIFLSQFTLKKSLLFSTLIFSQDPLQVTIGNSVASLQLAGTSDARIGLYNIDFVKSANELNYSRPPRLVLDLQNTPCILQNKFDTILIVQGGQMYVEIDLNNCIPLNSLQIRATILDPSSTGWFTFLDGTLVSTASVSVGALRVYYQIQCSTSATPNQTLQLQMEVLSNQDYQPNPNSITLSVQSASSQLSNPQPDPISYSTQTSNYVNIQVGCDQPGFIVWVAGAQNLNYEQFDSNYMYNTFVVQQTYVNCANIVTYCYDSILMNQPLMQFQVLIPNLVSRQQYYFKYYCRNQIGMFSNERSFTFKANDNQGRMNKITLQLNKQISDVSLIQTVLCFVSSKLVANYLRVVDPNNLSCQDTTLYTTTIKRTSDTVLYIYVLPNLITSSDQTSSAVTSRLSASSAFTYTINQISAQIQDYKTETYDDLVIPTFTYSQFTNDKDSLSMIVNFPTSSGFFIIGFITISESIPQKEQFLKQVNYLNSPIAKMQKFFIPKGLSRTIQFNYTSLVTEGRLYNSLFIAVPDNPQFNIDYTSDLQNKTFTIPASQINVVVSDPDTTYSSKMKQSMFTLLLLICYNLL